MSQTPQSKDLKCRPQWQSKVRLEAGAVRSLESENCCFESLKAFFDEVHILTNIMLSFKESAEFYHYEESTEHKGIDFVYLTC